MLQVLRLFASGAFIFFRGGVTVTASPVVVAAAVAGAAVAEAATVVLAAAAPVKGAAVADLRLLPWLLLLLWRVLL